jgi:hypothetical protein
MDSYDPIPLEEIKEAQKRIAPDIVRTPLIKLNVARASRESLLGVLSSSLQLQKHQLLQLNVPWI